MDEYAEFRKDMTLALLKNGRGSAVPEGEESDLFETRGSLFGGDPPRR